MSTTYRATYHIDYDADDHADAVAKAGDLDRYIGDYAEEIGGRWVGEHIEPAPAADPGADDHH